MSVLLVCLVLLEALPFLHSSLFFAPFGDMFLASMKEMEQDRLGKRSYGFMGQNETDRESGATAATRAYGDTLPLEEGCLKKRG